MNLEIFYVLNLHMHTSGRWILYPIQRIVKRLFFTHSADNPMI